MLNEASPALAVGSMGEFVVDDGDDDGDRTWVSNDIRRPIFKI